MNNYLENAYKELVTATDPLAGYLLKYDGTFSNQVINDQLETMRAVITDTRETLLEELLKRQQPKERPEEEW